MLVDYIPKLKQIYDICPDKEIYLYGKCLFDIMMNKEVTTLDLLVKTKQIDDIVREQLEKTYHFNIKVDKNFDFSDENFTVHCIYCNVKDIITLNEVNVEGRWPALVDINKKNIRFTEKGKIAITESPSVILDAILLACDTNYNIEISTMKNILTHLEGLKKIETRKIYHFLREIFIKSDKPRKSISLINTLGISKELFNILLVESSIVNNLSKKDIYEYFAIIFDSIPKDDLDRFLVQQTGVHSRDADRILSISKIIELFIASPNKDIALAHKIINMYGLEKITTAIRLFRAMGHNDFANLIKKERNNFVDYRDMSLTVDMIKLAFRVNDLEAKKLLEQAKNIVITNKELVKDSTKLLILLNKSLTVEHI